VFCLARPLIPEGTGPRGERNLISTLARWKLLAIQGARWQLRNSVYGIGFPTQKLWGHRCNSDIEFGILNRLRMRQCQLSFFHRDMPVFIQCDKPDRFQFVDQQWVVFSGDPDVIFREAMHHPVFDIILKQGRSE
jgi:hypothetical protein